MRHFPSTKTQSDFHFVAFLKKALHRPDLHFIVMVVDVGPHLDLFDLNDFLLLFGFGFFLLLLILVFSVIKDLANRRLRIWRNFHQIKAGLDRNLSGVFGGDNPTFFSCMINQQDLRYGNIFIDARSIAF